MRYLQLIYLLLFLIAGGFLGQYVLGKYAISLGVVVSPGSAWGMFHEQRRMYPATAHLNCQEEAQVIHGWRLSFGYGKTLL